MVVSFYNQWISARAVSGLDCLDDDWSVDLDSPANDDLFALGDSLVQPFINFGLCAQNPKGATKTSRKNLSGDTDDLWEEDLHEVPEDSMIKPVACECIDEMPVEMAASGKSLSHGCTASKHSALRPPQRRGPPASFQVKQGKNQPEKAIRRPTSSDVLSGRGRRAQDHHGNMVFRSHVANLSDAFENAESKVEKTRFTQVVLFLLKGRSGRFLKSLGSDLWEELDDHSARLKVASAFRSFRKAKRGDIVSSSPLEKAPEGTVGAMQTSKDVRLSACCDVKDRAVLFDPDVVSSIGLVSSKDDASGTIIMQGAKPHVTTSEPASSDVLFGRGRAKQLHEGNTLFRKMIASRMKEYDKATKTRKFAIAEEILRELKQVRGSRFLMQTGSGWEEVNDQVARHKVATAFRTLRTGMKRSNKGNVWNR